MEDTNFDPTIEQAILFEQFAANVRAKLLIKKVKEFERKLEEWENIYDELMQECSDKRQSLQNELNTELLSEIHHAESAIQYLFKKRQDLYKMITDFVNSSNVPEINNIHAVSMTVKRMLE